MKHIDITFDFETAALCPTAAPLSIGAVAWNRNAKQSPFFETREFVADFFTNIDLTSCFFAGLTIDKKTQLFWSEQSEEAKNALLAGPKHTLRDTITDFFAWIEEIRKVVGAETVCLWSQGSDFDIAIMRNICEVLNMEIPVKYSNFRDHRTACMEFAAKVMEEVDGSCPPAQNPKKAYALVDEYKDGIPHTPVFDCKKSIYSTWQLMHQV